LWATYGVSSHWQCKINFHLPEGQGKVDKHNFNYVGIKLGSSRSRPPSPRTCYSTRPDIFFCFCTGFRPTKSGRLIRLVCKGMRTDQALFPLGIKPGIPRVRPWNELLATGTQTIWFPLDVILNKLWNEYICFVSCYCHTKILTQETWLLRYVWREDFEEVHLYFSIC
jgi:hypothetical protein